MKLLLEILFGGHARKSLLIAFVPAILLLGACRKFSSAPVEPAGAKYIMDQIDSMPGSSLFDSLVRKAGLNGMLNDPGYYTVFVPDNNAFQAAGITLSSINGMSNQQAQFIARYLIVTPAFHLADTLQNVAFSQPGYPMIEFLNMDSLYLGLMQQGGSMYFNGVPFITKGITAYNGLLYPIHFFPDIPTQTIVDKLKSLGLNLLVAAINHSNLLPLFSSPMDSVTLLAPTDRAFNAAGFPDIASIANSSPATLDSLLEAHIITLKYFATNMSGDNYGYFFAVSNGANGIPVSQKLKWIIPGLVHNGHSDLIRLTQYKPDIYCFTLLESIYGGGVDGAEGIPDLGYVSDGTNYSFYRNVFFVSPSDSATVTHVVTPNITTVNGLIHVVDSVLPYHNVRTSWH